MHMADEDDAVFTSRLMAFYLSDMSAEIRRFCTARCEPFVEAEEHKLEYTEVFHEFEALVESLLARFVAHEYSRLSAACRPSRGSAPRARAWTTRERSTRLRPSQGRRGRGCGCNARARAASTRRRMVARARRTVT